MNDTLDVFATIVEIVLLQEIWRRSQKGQEAFVFFGLVDKIPEAYP
jgi:hypothetical protein